MADSNKTSLGVDIFLIMAGFILGVIIGIAVVLHLAQMKTIEIERKHYAERALLQSKVDLLVDAVLKNGDGKEWAFKVLKEVISNEKKVSE